MKSIKIFSAILFIIVCIFNTGCANKIEISSSVVNSSDTTQSSLLTSETSSAEITQSVSISPTSTPISPTKAPIKPTMPPGRVTSMSIKNDSVYLTIKVSGRNLDTKSQFYINADKNYSTGLKTKWANSGFDYLVENDILYKYTGVPNKWNWTRVSGITQEKSDRYIIVKVPLVSINSKTGSVLQIGFLSNDNRAIVYPSLETAIPKYKVS